MTDRAENLTDVVAVERVAPGLVRVVSWGDAYMVDARDAGCNCPDKLYNDAKVCKHEWAARAATSDLPTPFSVADSLDQRAIADGGKRPDECACEEMPDGETLACPPCFFAGFDEVNQ